MQHSLNDHSKIHMQHSLIDHSNVHTCKQSLNDHSIIYIYIYAALFCYRCLHTPRDPAQCYLHKNECDLHQCKSIGVSFTAMQHLCLSCSVQKQCGLSS